MDPAFGSRLRIPPSGQTRSRDSAERSLSSLILLNPVVAQGAQGHLAQGHLAAGMRIDPHFIPQ